MFVDAGVFTGLVETLDEAIRYRLETRRRRATGPCVLAGPTCDSADVLYETTPVWLPLSLAEGDELRIHAAGAYSTCYSTVGFNGFAPLPPSSLADGPGDLGVPAPPVRRQAAVEVACRRTPCCRRGRRAP